mmetsp:Transcript_27955/g.50903  ORF Transcript_27955/g.50903 Transcript_27955/m.50903 type:complete len:636 (-) Transcript_27955:406-2313(-)
MGCGASSTKNTEAEQKTSSEPPKAEEKKADPAPAAKAAEPAKTEEKKTEAKKEEPKKFDVDEKLEDASLGVIRLDYDYPPAKGDIDHPGSFCYDVYYRVVPGLTFEMCQSGKMTPEVEKEFVEAVKYLEGRGVRAITGDCGFMMYFQALARQNTKLPVFMSSLAHLPAITCGYSFQEKIAVFTANSETLKPMKPLIKDECGVDADEQRYVIVGCQDVPGFEAVAAGEKVDVAKVTPGMVKKCKEVLAEHPTIRAILMECTELPPYSDALRHVTGLPVYDAITCCDFFINGMRDNPRFGINDWHQEWDGVQEAYRFGKHLSKEDKEKLVNKASKKEEDNPNKSKLAEPAVKKQKKAMQLMAKVRAERAAASLGVVRLDYNYPPAPGDIDSPQSYAYDVYYRVVPGLTFTMCQSGKMTPEVEKEFIEAINYLKNEKKVSAITGDCGFMMYFQALARQHCHLPILMSSLAQLPAVTCAFSKDELIAVFTANSETLTPMRGLIKDECGVEPEEKRFVIVGCQDVPGFEAVAAGEKVDVEKVTPGMVAKAKEVMTKHPGLRGILLECTELPPYADALRYATGLPVYDSITGCDLFMSGLMDNPRFGLNNWHEEWDGEQEAYEFGKYLDEEDKAKLVNKAK